VKDMRLRLFYRVSAWSLILALGVLVLLNIAVGKAGGESVKAIPSALKIPIGAVGALGAFGFFALWLGMLWNCVATPNRSIAIRWLWLLLILFSGPIGALVYYFLAFRSGDEAHAVKS
jgi:hypothetical protein